MNDHEIDSYTQEELVNLVKSNNKMLKQINRREQMRSLFSFVKLTIILALFAFGYFTLQPYLEKLSEVYQKIGETSESVSGFSEKVSAFGEFDLEALKNILE